jgi:hypothetical protein
MFLLNLKPGESRKAGVHFPKTLKVLAKIMRERECGKKNDDFKLRFRIFNT